jgi:trehalose/maltose hydrolase-like predicted phosphorylase
VNNSVYTNVVAKMSLEFATLAGKILGIDTPSHWTTVANNIKVPYDPEKNYHPGSNTTQEQQRILFTHLFLAEEYDGYDGEKIKQADVVLLGFPLNYPMKQSTRFSLTQNVN